jgi:hypothetical protein
MANSHRFYVPVGMVALAAPPVAPVVGETYFDTVLGQLRSWDGTQWMGSASDVDLKDRFVDVSGDGMTGELILPDQVAVPPSAPSVVAAKGYVDQLVTVSDAPPVSLPVRDGLIWSVMEAKAWTPVDIPSIGLWLEADQITGAVDGSPVSVWPDGSGRGFDAVPTSAPPVWRQVGIGGQPSVEFGPNTPLRVQGLGTAASGKAEHTLFQVLFASNPAAWPIVTSAPTTGPFQWLTQLESYSVVWGQPDSTRYSQYAVSGVATPILLTYSMHAIDGPKFYYNSATSYVIANGSGGAVLGPLPSLGADVVMGAYFDGTGPLVGQIAAMLWYDRVLLDEERQQVESYLRGKYGLAIGDDSGERS